MITYTPGYWNVSFSFSLKGSVFPKSCAWAASSSVLTVILHLWMHLHEEAGDAAKGVGDGGTSILSGFTFILGFLLVFRSQQAYSRWWEGGTLMQQLRGEWFNATSCLIAFCNSSPEKSTDVVKFQHQLVRLVSLLYASALQQVCTMEDKGFELIEITGFQRESLEFLESDLCHDHCEVVLQWIQRLVVTADAEGIVKIAPPILSRVYNQLGNGIVNLNNARKISEFQIPFPLAQMITVMLLFHWCMTPLICVTTVDSVWLSAILCFVVVFSYWSINYIATELEMPFGDDPNDLPLRDMQSDLNASLITLMQERAATCPEFEFRESHISLALVRLNPAELANESHVPEKQDKVKKERNKASKKPPRPSSPVAGKLNVDGESKQQPEPQKRDVGLSQVQNQQWSQATNTNIHQLNLICSPGVSLNADGRFGAETQGEQRGAPPQQLGCPAVVSPAPAMWNVLDEASDIAKVARSPPPQVASHNDQHHHQSTPSSATLMQSRQAAVADGQSEARCLPFQHLTSQSASTAGWTQQGSAV